MSEALAAAPMTHVRTPAWPTSTPTSQAKESVSMWAMYSGNVSHAQKCSNELIAGAGMSSIASHRSVTKPRRGLGQGARPTAQLPVTTVVTPLPEDGDTSGSHIICVLARKIIAHVRGRPRRAGERAAGQRAHLCVVVRVRVDPPRRDVLADGIDLARSLHRERRPDAHDSAVLDGHIADEWRRAGPVDDGATADDQVGHASRCEREVFEVACCWLAAYIAAAVRPPAPPRAARRAL